MHTVHRLDTYGFCIRAGELLRPTWMLVSRYFGDSIEGLSSPYTLEILALTTKK